MAESGVLRRGLALVAFYVRLHPWPFALAVGGAAVFSAATVASTMVMGRITDSVVIPTFTTGSVPDIELRWMVAFVAALTVLRVVGVALRRYYAAVTYERVQKTLRDELSDQYLALPMEWYQRQSAGQLIAHAENDVEVAAEALNPLPFSIGVAFLAVFSAISMVIVDPILAAVGLTVFPALLILNQIYTQRIHGPAAEVQASVGRVSSIAHESFDGAMVVKVLGRAEQEGERFEDAVRQLQRNRLRVGYMRALFESILDVLPNLGIIIVLMVGIFRVEAGAVRPGDLVQVASLFMVLAFPIRVFGYFLESIAPSTVAFARIKPVLEHPVPVRGDQTTLSDRGGLAVRAEQIRFGYTPESYVLDGVNFSLEPGEVVALVGATGAGKTTLCQLLAGLVPPTAGTIELNGIDVRSIDPVDRTNRVALVFQEPFLFADSIRGNIDLLDRADPATIERAVQIAQINRFVDDLPDGLDSPTRERGVSLSGGQRQRVALARALVTQPQLLILDDATSAVDARVEQQILAGLRSDLEATTVIVAQRVATIALADRVMYLRDGQIAGMGTHAELLEHPEYAALVKAYEEAEVQP